jgi:hypothetical protein
MTGEQEIRFNFVIEKWERSLISHISSAVDIENKVVIIALSRKMPRLLEWIENNNTSFKEEFSRLKKSCVYTTEHSIPLVFNEGDSAKVFILDDLIRTGQTVQSVVDEVFSLTTHIPTVLAPFKFVDASIQNCELSFVQELTEKETETISKGICDIIQQSNLPVDMEYPIVKTRDCGILENREPINVLHYQVDSSNSSNFAYILEDETRYYFNNDFAKLRFFRDANGIKVVPFAPNIFSESALITDKLFVNEKYKSMYRMVLDRMDVEKDYWLKWNSLNEESGERKRLLRIFRTLTVWANYLFSLSAFIRFKAQGGCAHDTAYRVEEEDLELILGKNLAQALQPGLNCLIKDDEVSPSTRELLNVPSVRIHPKLIGTYKVFKYRAVLGSTTVEEALRHIFNTCKSVQNISRQHYIESMDSIVPEETYESLFEALSMRFDIRESKLKVYRWIDQQVDRGYIVPRYEQVVGEFDTHYWRRYFRVSH